MRKTMSPFFLLISIFPMLLDAKPIRVGVEEIQYLPYWHGQNNQYFGFGRELLDAFAKTYKLEFDYVPMPVKRLYTELISGGVDLKFPDCEYWQAEMKKGSKIKYSVGVVPFVDGVFRKKENIGKDRSVLAVLGTVRSFTPWEYLEDIGKKKLTLFEANTTESLLNLLSLNRVDGAYVSVAVAENVLRQSKLLEGSLIFDISLPHTSNFYSLSTKSMPKIIEQFDKWFKKNKKLIKNLRKKWYLLNIKGVKK